MVRCPTLLRIAARLSLLALLAGCSPGSDRRALLEGVRALQAGHNEAAARLLEDSLRESPEPSRQAVILNYLGVARIRLNQPDQAAAAFRDSARADPGLAAPRYNLAVLKDDQGLETDALALLDQAAAADPAAVAALDYAAAIHIRHQRWDAARQALHDALKRDPRAPSVLTALALLDLQAGRLEEARGCLRKALDRAPNYAPAVYNLALLHARLPEGARQAARHFEHVLTLAPPEPYAGLARAALAPRRDPAPAPAPPPGPTPPPPAARPAYALDFENAQTLAAANRPAAAVNLFLRAAAGAEQAAQPDLARDAVARAQALCPAAPEPRLALATYWLDHGQPANARPLVRDAVGARPDWPDALVARARLAVLDHTFDDALDSLARALAREPSHPDALWLRATLYEDHLKTPAKALSDLRRFVQDHPDDPRADQARTRLRRLETGARRP